MKSCWILKNSRNSFCSLFTGGVYFFKIVNGWSTPSLRSVVSVSNITFIRGHRFQLFVLFICKNECMTYFTYRTIPI